MVEPKEIQEPTVTVRGTRRPVPLDYAERLIGRGQVDRRRVRGPDPHCKACGHRALDHGLADVSQDDRHRWFNAEPMPCRWRPGKLDAAERAMLPGETREPCGCSAWIPGTFRRTAVESVGEASVFEAWVEVPLDGAWIVGYGIVNDQGTPVVGELRLFPAEPDRPGPGRWSAELLGLEARAPRGGITARVLRRVRVRAYLAKMSHFIRDVRAAAPGLADMYGWSVREAPVMAESRLEGQRRGPKGRPDSFYARVARDYVRALERGSYEPVAAVARRRGESVAKVRDMIRRARKRGLLTLEGPGKRGGVLTEQAEALLRPVRAKGKRRTR